ncbi:MAG: YIP1 family protein [Halolamina sp.]
MTTWTEHSGGGRDRGLRGVVRAWLSVLTRPRRFFAAGVAPGDQAPGLVFFDLVALTYVVGLFAAEPSAVPALPGGTAAAVTLAVLAVAVAVAPATLHLTAALQTVLLIVAANDRAGVSETVQVVGYAAAPLALAGPPIPALRAVAAGYAGVLLVVGLATVHETSLPRATAAGVVPAYLLFGLAAGGVDAVAALT